MTDHLILTVIAAIVVGLVVGAIVWQTFISGPEISMADADRLAAIEDRDRAVRASRELDAVREDLARERAVNRHLHRDLYERSLTPRPLYERIGEPKPLDLATVAYEGSKAGDTGWWRMPRIPDDVRGAVELHIGAHTLVEASS